SVAVAALRSPTRGQVRPDDHAAVLKVWSKRHRDLGRTRTHVACRLHAVLCELVPAASPRRSSQLRLVISWSPSRRQMPCRQPAAEHIEALRRIDARMHDSTKNLAAAVQASGTSLTQIFGVGPVIAATVIGAVRDVSRFPDRDHFAAYNGTAPIEVSSGRCTVYRLSRRV